MKEYNYRWLKEENGYVLVLALLALLILTLIGIAGLTTSGFESMIAGNDRQAKRTFYKAESGTELGAELLEYNFSCGPVKSAAITSAMQIVTPDLFHNTKKSPEVLPSSAANTRDICWPSADIANPKLADCSNQNAEQTSIRMYGKRERAVGAAQQMGAGYEGPGRGPGGTIYRHQIVASNVLSDASSAAVQIEWIHVIGQEDPGSCY